MSTDIISKNDSYGELPNSSGGVTTKEAREWLEDTLFSALRCEASTLIDAPTSLGKSHIVATTPWREYPDVTGGELVIHLHQTTDARDEAIEKSENTAEVEYQVFRGREDSCPIAAGDHDERITAPDGRPASEWFEWMCDVRKNGFVTAHFKLEEHCDLPCTDDGPCKSIDQWWQNLHDEDGNPTVDVVHTTTNFAHVSELIEDANLIFDERPDYSLMLDDSDRQQMRDSVSNLLRHRSDGERAMPHLKTASLDDLPELKQELRTFLAEEELDQDWYFGWEETHQLAPAIGLAMLDAEEVFSHRWRGKDHEKAFSRRWMGEHDRVKVVMDGKGKLRHVHYKPDFSESRCVIGLDAFPSVYRWRLNTVDYLQSDKVMTPKERRTWRREERGLEVIQVGDDTRSYTNGWKGAGEERSAGLIHTLRQKHGHDFRSCIMPDAIENDVRQQMNAAGIENPLLMHFGVQNSRNSFKDELVGLVAASIDPGDEPILDLLALGGKRAWPEMMITDEGKLERKPNRSFLGPDADIAHELLETVRESNLAQAAGRYARKPDTQESSARVYVWCDACPDSLVDEKIEAKYRSFTKKRLRMIESLHDGCRTASEIVEATDSEKSYIHDCLRTFYQQDLVTKSEGTGAYGATEWRWIGGEVGSDDSLVVLDL